MQKTILVLSQEDDPNTVEVLKWLTFWKKAFTKINDEDELSLEMLSQSDNFIDFNVKIKGRLEHISLTDLQSFWFRRGRLHLPMPDSRNLIISPSLIESIDLINRNIFRENNTIIDMIAYLLNNKIPSLGNYQQYFNNKLIHHDMAKLAGLKVPTSYIVSNKKSAIDVLKKHSGSLLIKSIGDSPIIKFAESEDLYSCILYVTEITESDIQSLPETFFPTLFQVKIEKRFEIRSFFLKGKFFSMAILSQSDYQTKIDFRNYNNEKPNRWVPFTLPVEISVKLSLLMKMIGLDTGSIDIIYTNTKEYYFLEVNPVGQFGMVSGPCNYQLEKKIAHFLCSNEDE